MLISLGVIDFPAPIDMSSCRAQAVREPSRSPSRGRSISTEFLTKLSIGGLGSRLAWTVGLAPRSVLPTYRRVVYRSQIENADQVTGSRIGGRRP